jgi:hypothetical protein
MLYTINLGIFLSPQKKPHTQSAIIPISTVLPPMNYLGNLFKNQLPLIVKTYCWTLNFIPLIYMSSFMPVPYCFGGTVVWTQFWSVSTPSWPNCTSLLSCLRLAWNSQSSCLSFPSAGVTPCATTPSFLIVFFSTEVLNSGPIYPEPLHQSFYVMDFFEIGSGELFAWIGLEPQSSWSLPPE